MTLGSEFLPTPAPNNSQLEAAIREAPADPGPAAVYADWLQAQGSPIGELVALWAALEKGKDPRKRERADALDKQLVLPEPAFATWETRNGFWQWLRLENQQDWMSSSFDAPAFARKLFASPLCCALETLRIGILRWDHNSDDVPAVLRVAGDHAWSKTLAHLHLGDVSSDIDMAHHVIGDVGAAITAAFPALRMLKLHSGSQEWRGGGETFSFAGLALPRLESLVIETCAMTPERLDALFAVQLPALARLDVWFGDPERDAPAECAQLAPLFDGSAFPKVTHLGLVNCAFGDELVDRFAASNLGARLETLDLSKGVIDDDIAANLATIADRFPKLRVLDVSDNYVTAGGAATLKQAFPKAEVVIGDQPKLEYAEEGERFVSVGE